jgi:hypothetical protein
VQEPGKPRKEWRWELNTRFLGSLFNPFNQEMLATSKVHHLELCEKKENGRSILLIGGVCVSFTGFFPRSKHLSACKIL